ncbi:hypothetical protein A2Z33_06060 [Candidatus Gottesmanbacteria bacterium RBG_16_52_11]|uniref:Cupin type-2 domain-containing protein n=1 Tax=Candidatus Gottesmanbacteria bacterium RBG_16_52_11 TaxID=1798374 RepID=A0A1F5YY71_9BACT|nr:MAG: hypothetical protein A2Z33_06060 [Candidatus Gottesmanbacteria bacterium RBG_16_52_11]
MIMRYKSLVKPPVSRVLKSGLVVLKPGENVGEHVTENREEILIVLAGRASVMVNGHTVTLPSGESHFIPVGTAHNVINRGRKELKYIYVVSPTGVAG